MSGVLKKLRMPLNLQFFAEGNGDNSGNDSNVGNEESSNNNGSSNDNDESGAENKNEKNVGKMFTQEQVNAMMAKEKNQGKKSVLKSLGFASEDEAKKAFSLFKALMDSQKDDDEKSKEENKDLKIKKQEAEDRAILAEAKLSCVLAGVNKESVDDVITIALSKISDDENLDKVLENMKKEKRYVSFFTKASDSGTGRTPGNSVDNQKAGSYGERLAKARVRKVESDKKSNFF